MLVGVAGAVMGAVALWFLFAGKSQPTTNVSASDDVNLSAVQSEIEVTSAVASEKTAPEETAAIANPDPSSVEPGSAAEPLPDEAELSPNEPLSNESSVAPLSEAPPSEQGVTTSDAAVGSEGRRVVVRSDPPGALFYQMGREVGRTEITVDVPPGEKRVFEVILPGYVTRKLVVDGSEEKILFGLRPKSVQ